MEELVNYQEKLKAMTDWVQDNVYELEELCLYLDITYDDVLKSFPDALVGAYNKTFITEDTDDTEEVEEEAWRGYSISEDGE